MNTKRICCILVVAVMMTLVLCGCPSSDPIDTTPSGTSGTTVPPVIPTTTAPPTVSNKITLTVTIVDQNNNPVPNVTLQFCDDANCKLPVNTDANGTVTVSYDPSNYHVSLTQLPEGYTSEADTYYFDEGSVEMTIVITAP